MSASNALKGQQVHRLVHKIFLCVIPERPVITRFFPASCQHEFSLKIFLAFYAHTLHIHLHVRQVVKLLT